jgi:hypothetical protein
MPSLFIYPEGKAIPLQAITYGLQRLRENRKRNSRSLHYATLRSG